MKKKLGLIFVAVLALSHLCFAQELKPASSKSSPIATDPEIQWVWGEIVTVNATDNSILIRFIDYESDTEKEVVVFVDGKTTYEKANSFNEIKPQDTVSVDYVVNGEGKAVAQNISVENLEESAVSGGIQSSR